jgi:hypothetical protein
MAYAKNPNRYPEYFSALFAKSQLEDVVLCCENENERTSLMQQLHGYRKAMEDTRTPGYEDASQALVRKGADYDIILESRNKALNAILEKSGITKEELEPFKREAPILASEIDLTSFEDEVDIFNKLTEKGNDEQES